MINIISFIVVAIVLLVVAILFHKRRRATAGATQSASSKQAQPAPNCQLYIGNVSYRATESMIRDFFAEYGDVENISVIKDRRTGRSKGFAFVTFSSLKSSKAALDAHGVDFNGRSLIVRYAKPQT